MNYPKPLPSELQEFYIYTPDGGHYILCVLKKAYRPGSNLSDSLIPVPVKTVLREYEINNGYVTVDLPYDSELGLMLPENDEEF